MELRPGYKRTVIGVIPEDWEVARLGEVAELYQPVTISAGALSRDGYPVYGANGIVGFYGSTNHDTWQTTITCRGSTCGTVNRTVERCWITGNAMVVNVDQNSRINKEFFYFLLLSQDFADCITGTGQPQIVRGPLADFSVAIPALPTEQAAIAQALSDVDAAITALSRLIAKKRDLRQGAMQRLLTGQTRLLGFTAPWTMKTLEQAAECLDNVRIPLNETQRAAMKGDYPYCGANGVLGYVNNYVIDDDIILMAEDGGYFDEFETRPIAYRMTGKCWVNNHAHILKARAGYDQGFLFYSLVHKNILPFLASGTRAKLNKSELYKIEVNFPNEESEQTVIAEILTDIDAEIAALDARVEKIRLLRQAMMQALLTGRIRLPVRHDAASQTKEAAHA